MVPSTETFTPRSRAEWRDWLTNHHDKCNSVWLVYYKTKTGLPTVTYNEAVDEALCFGWIDSKAKPLDNERYMQFFSRRKPGSVWSRVNKEKVEKLIQEGRMAPAGLRVIELARANGSWTILDEAEALVVPADLEAAFEQHPVAAVFFNSLSRTDKRNLLQWLVLARRNETRQKRISELVEQALLGKKPKQF